MLTKTVVLVELLVLFDVTSSKVRMDIWGLSEVAEKRWHRHMRQTG